jgi:gluconolactonase
MKLISLLFFVPYFFSNNFNSADTEKHIGVKDESALFASGTKPILISKQFSFTEGPAVDKKGNVYFTDQPNDKIWKYSEDGKLTVFMEKTGRSNGMYFDSKGNLIACADENNQLWSISPSGKVKVILKDFEGQKFNGPNDVWVAPNGGMYFTDPYYQRDYWQRTKPELSAENLYYLPKGAKKPVVAADGFVRPNGLIGTPDGKFLYVSDLNANKTYRYSIDAEGILSNKTLFVEQGSDGMTIDNQGNVYLTGKGVTVYDPQGKKITNIPLPTDWTANVCFFGKDKNLLFITAGQGVYYMPMKVKGVK